MNYLPGVAFIIIGRNEGWKLELCIKSVLGAIESNAIDSYEVIYVDSDSRDNSVNIALGFTCVSVIKLSGVCNAAIARNIGAASSQLCSLFFIDGDMEINAEFLDSALDEDGLLKMEFVSGQLKNFNYDNDWNKIGESWQYSAVLSGDKVMPTCGGIFLVDHELWDRAGGMDNRFKRGQDLDFSLNMSGIGKHLYRKKDIVALHHTISYTHHDRIWRTLFSGDILYSKSLLYRKHWAKKAMYIKMLQTDYSMVMMLACLLSMLFTKSPLGWIAYVALVAIRVIKKTRHNTKDLLNNLAFVPVRDALALAGILAFHPQRPKSGDFQVDMIRIVNSEDKVGQHE